MMLIGVITSRWIWQNKRINRFKNYEFTSYDLSDIIYANQELKLIDYQLVMFL